MTMLARLGGAWQTITAGRIFAGGAWKPLIAVKIYANGAWRDVARFVQPLTLAISPSPFTKGGTGPVVTSGNITATPTGGGSPFTYNWTVVTSSSPVTINNPSLGTTTVSANVGTGTVTCTLQCVATDFFGTTASAQVSGTFYYRDTTGIGGTQ